MILPLSLLLLAAAQAAASDDLAAHGGSHQHGETHAHGHADMSSPAIESAHIIVTINPEARVSAARGKRLPQIPCGQPLPIRIAVLNQGFVTATLAATLVGEGGRHVALDFSGPRLTGKPIEVREMRLTSIGSNPADITIAFSISQEIGDLNSRDRIHLLVTCR